MHGRRKVLVTGGAVCAAQVLYAIPAPGLSPFAVGSLGLAPWSPELRRTILVALGTVGTACACSLAVLGATVAGLVVAVGLGTTAYAWCMWHQRQSIHLQALLDSLRGASQRTLSDPRPILEHS